MNPRVDGFLRKEKRWQKEMILLREIVLDCGLDEDIKWMHPCFTLGDANIVLIHGFKEYCALLFFKGVLMKDPRKLLIQQTENVQDRRQMRFASIDEIRTLAPYIKKYIAEAIAVERSGKKIVYKKTSEFSKPEEFSEQLKRNKRLKNAFEALTPGRQRGYLLYFSSAKQSSTRITRIEKNIPKILAGKGLDD